MTEDNVGTCRPALLKLLMESKNIVLFQTINVKLFLSVTGVICLDSEGGRQPHAHCITGGVYWLTAHGNNNEKTAKLCSLGG